MCTLPPNIDIISRGGGGHLPYKISKFKFKLVKYQAYHSTIPQMIALLLIFPVFLVVKYQFQPKYYFCNFE